MTTFVKETKPDQPKQPSDRKRVAKHVTVDQRVHKYGRYGLYNNNGLFGKSCGKTVDYHGEDSIQSHMTAHFMTITVSTYVLEHRMYWLRAMKTINSNRNNAS